LSQIGLAFSSLRVGRRYKIENYREEFNLQLMEILHPQDFLFKSVDSLEPILMSEIIQFGKGEDFVISEV
jgi:hypothetical protein